MIYIATPHPFHIEQAKLCINHGKPVLCEKPFTVNAVGAKEVFALAKEKEVFITEAIWTRYLPSRKIIDDIIASGEIGEIKGISANLGYDMHTKERLIDPFLYFRIMEFCASTPLSNFTQEESVSSTSSPKTMLAKFSG